MGNASNTLKISPNYNADHWRALNPSNPADWATAAAILDDRLRGRFLDYATSALESPFSGFVVLAIDSLLIEAIQQFREGLLKADGLKEQREKLRRKEMSRTSKDLITTFLSGHRFSPDFDDPEARNRYYWDIRCGLLHQAEAKEMWRVRRCQHRMLQKAAEGHGYTIDVERFHVAVQGSLADYVLELQHEAHMQLRKNLWTKMEHICALRYQRNEAYPIVDET